MVAGRPRRDVAVPESVRALAEGGAVRPVWENELGGLTFEIEPPSGRSFVKWTPRKVGVDLGVEAERTRWVAMFTIVPAVLAVGEDDDGSWLMTASLAGESAVAPRWLADPAGAVAAIGRGLRRLHDAVPVAPCPFTWSVEHRLAVAGRLDLLGDAPAVDKLVVCHGDACSPNTIVGEDGSFVGHVDLGALGVGDRWADLAVATYSSIWNYGPGWEDALLHAYGIDPDPERTAWYRMMWDLDD